MSPDATLFNRVDHVVAHPFSNRIQSRFQLQNHPYIGHLLGYAWNQHLELGIDPALPPPNYIHLALPETIHSVQGKHHASGHPNCLPTGIVWHQPVATANAMPLRVPCGM